MRQMKGEKRKEIRVLNILSSVFQDNEYFTSWIMNRMACTFPWECAKGPC